MSSKAQLIITRVLAGSSAILLSSGGFLIKIAPPEEAGRRAVQFSVGIVAFFILAGFLGLLAYTAKLTKTKRSTVWKASGLIGLFLAIVGASLYLRDRRYIAEYPPDDPEPARYVKGKSLTEAAEYVKTYLGGSASDEMLMRKFGGDPAKVWKQDSIEDMRIILTAEYILFVMPLSMCLMCFAEAIVIKA